MLVELITTGSELLLGEIWNNNSRYLSQELNKMGYSVVFHTTVGDNPKRMESALVTALSRADIIITTGGLGPTQGEITKEITAQLLGLPMEFYPEIREQIAAWFKRSGKPMTQNNDRQCYFAEGATIFTNEAGTAPGCAISWDDKIIAHLPGPPRELQWMFEKRLKPYLLETFGSQGCIESLIVKVYDLGESEMEDMIMDLMKNQSNPTLALYAKPGYIELRITAQAETAAEASQLLKPMEQILRERLHRAAVTYNNDTMAELLKEKLEQHHFTVSAAESCTGGLVGSFITDVPGSSEYFRGSAVTYCDEMKHHILQVSQETLQTVGAVSTDTAGQMARGSRKLYCADIAISTTGIAGPGGGTAENPVGLVYIGIDGPWGTVIHRDVFPGDRPEIKRRAATRAIYYAVQYLIENEQ